MVSESDDPHEAVLAALKQLDGSKASLVSLLSGASSEELDELGGFRDE